ncbi:hypothetical protein OPAG_05146 [Rhodococcus opacus PD630]|nr:hypothetical protein OPAG_05146 [Rhodococcus opacus PD630]
MAVALTRGAAGQCRTPICGARMRAAVAADAYDRRQRGRAPAEQGTRRSLT